MVRHLDIPLNVVPPCNCSSLKTVPMATSTRHFIWHLHMIWSITVSTQSTHRE